MSRTTEENLFIQLRSLYPTLTRTEKKIADYVIVNAGDIVFESITEFAEKCGVSETSIVRFSRSIGLSGFQEFKLILARVTAVPPASPRRTDDEEGILHQLIQTVSDENELLLRNTLVILEYAAFEAAVYKLASAMRIAVYGAGDCGFAALEAAYKLKSLGLFAEAVVDPHFQQMSAAMLMPDDIAIGISSTGIADGTLHALDTARTIGATTICITDHAQSPIVKVADIVLLTAAPNVSLDTPVKSRIAQIHLLDLIYAATAFAINDKKKPGSPPDP